MERTLDPRFRFAAGVCLVSTIVSGQCHPGIIFEFLYKLRILALCYGLDIQAGLALHLFESSQMLEWKNRRQSSS
jgi:hypothetical protein